jgi:asparaginyl-tRNA synthetase
MAAAQDLADRTKPEAIYIDTDTGVDEESTPGSESKPYKSLAYAYIQHGGAEGKK